MSLSALFAPSPAVPDLRATPRNAAPRSTVAQQLDDMYARMDERD